MATLGGYCGDAAPRDDAGFSAFARSLASPAFADAIEGREPLEEARIRSARQLRFAGTSSASPSPPPG